MPARAGSPPDAPGSALQSRRGRALLPPVLLVLLGIGLELCAVGLWPVAFDLTQGADFSQEYLVQYGRVWDFFRPILYRFEELYPETASSLEQLTTMLTLWWVASFALYLAALVAAHRAGPSRLAVGLVVGFTPLFQLTLMLMPGILTTDLFSYTMYGYIARVYDLNPYLYPPGYFPDNKMTSWIHPVWYYSPSIYGPFWVDLSWWLTGFTAQRSAVDQALVYRLVANLANLANLGLLALLLRRMGARALAPGLLLYAWNPLLLFEFAASAHNDVLVMTFVLLAFLLAAYRRYPLAVASLTLATMIKVTPVLVLPLLVLHWASQCRGARRRLAVLAASGAIVLGIVVGLYWRWYEGPQTFLLVEFWSKGPMYNNWAPDLLATTIADQWLDPALEDQERSLDTARTALKWLTRAVFLVYFCWELLRLRRLRQVLAASGRVFLVFLLLVNTWVMPWYHTWAFILAIPLWPRAWLARVTLALTLTAPLYMYNHHYWSSHLPGWTMLLYLAPLALPLLGVRRWRGFAGMARRRDSETAG